MCYQDVKRATFSRSLIFFLIILIIEKTNWTYVNENKKWYTHLKDVFSEFIFINNHQIIYILLFFLGRFQTAHSRNESRHYSIKSSFKRQKHFSPVSNEGMALDTDNRCSVCHKNFSTAGSLKRHMELHIFQRKNFHCEFCGRRFSWKTDYRNHIRSKHSIMWTRIYVINNAAEKVILSELCRQNIDVKFLT